MLFSSSSLCPFGLQIIILYVFSVWYLRRAETGLDVENAESPENKEVAVTPFRASEIQGMLGWAVRAFQIDSSRITAGLLTTGVIPSNLKLR